MTGTIRQRFIVERDGAGCLAVWPDGRIRRFGSPAKTLAAIKRCAAIACREGRSPVISEIEWRDGLAAAEGK